jgi:hypothetical protein
MARFWIIDKGQILFIGMINDQGKTDSERKIEMHKAIIQALKEARKDQ